MTKKTLWCVELREVVHGKVPSWGPWQYNSYYDNRRLARSTARHYRMCAAIRSRVIKFVRAK